MRRTLAVVSLLLAAVALVRPAAQSQAQFHSGTELVSEELTCAIVKE
jgi:hypothetical protein